MIRGAVAVLVLAALLTGCGALVAGCGSSSSASSSSAGTTWPSESTSPAASPLALPTLPAAAVPYLPSTAKALTARGLAREAASPELAARLGQWGFVAGSQRYFQGESRRLQVVDSRTLRFRRAAGAGEFVVFMRAHLGAILGSFPKIRTFALGARRGILAVGQECQCHLANPSFLALVVRGGTVSWLEINGPGATRRRLAALLARAP
jgi:hypothetical protein